MHFAKTFDHHHLWKLDLNYIPLKYFANHFQHLYKQELALKNTLEKAKKEKIDVAITTQYDQLMSAIQKSEEALLDKNQKEIKKLILDEIIKRYQYKEGLYQYYTKSNPEIIKATTLLANKAEYSKILN